MDSANFEALRKRYQQHSLKAQAYYTIMHKAKEFTGSDDAASLWMNTPLAELDGQTPAQLADAGQAEDVLRYIDSLKA